MGEEVCIHQFNAQAYFLSEENSWDEVKNGEVLDFNLLEDQESTLFRLVGWTQSGDVAINVNLCRKSEFKIDHERFSYVSVPGDTSVGQLLGMSFLSEDDNKKGMAKIAAAIEKMKEKRRLRDQKVVSTSSAYDDEGEENHVGTHFTLPESSDEEKKDDYEDELPPDTPPPSDLRPLTKFLESMNLQDEIDVLADNGFDTIGRIMIATRDGLRDVPVKSVTRKILVSAAETLKPYIQELEKEGEDWNRVLLNDDSILATLRALSNQIRNQASSLSPRRPPRPASRPDMLESLRASSQRRSRKSPLKRTSITSDKVLSAAQRSAENRMRRSFKGSNLDVTKKVPVSVRARTDSHSPYIRASTVRAPTPGHVDRDGISRVYNLQRKVHVKYNEKKARFDHVPEGMELHFNRQFGVPIKQCPAIDVKGYKSKIPAVLVMMRSEMIKYGGLETEGIFRLAPERAACARTKQDINMGKFEMCDDVNIMANLIKVWFRDLPDKLLNAAPPSAIDHTARVGEAGAEEFISKMHEPERSVLLWLLDMGAEIVRSKRKTRMDARNMSIVLSPNLYQPTDEEPMAAMARMSKVVQSMHALLKWRIEQTS
eukprot:g2476.t1